MQLSIYMKPKSTPMTLKKSNERDNDKEILGTTSETMKYKDKKIRNLRDIVPKQHLVRSVN